MFLNELINSNSNLNAFVVSGTGENGATYTITISGANPAQQTGTVSGGVWQQTFDIVNVPDGPVTVQAQATDSARNSRTTSVSMSKDVIIGPALTVSRPRSRALVSNTLYVLGGGEARSTVFITAKRIHSHCAQFYRGC